MRAGGPRAADPAYRTPAGEGGGEEATGGRVATRTHGAEPLKQKIHGCAPALAH